MTSANDSTMAASKATDTTFKTVMCPNKSKQLKATIMQKEAAERTHAFTIWVYFLPLQANTKFNPTASMHIFLSELSKYEPSIIIVNPINKAQLIVKLDLILAKEIEFRK